MGIEAFNLQKPVILIMMVGKKIQAGLNRLNAGHVLFVYLSGSVGVMLYCRNSCFIERVLIIHGHCLTARNPTVAFLPSKPLPSRITVMVRSSAILEIMRMIRNQMTVNPLFLQPLKNRVIKAFQRPPATMKEVISPCMQLSSCRHARHASAIKVGKSHGFLS